MRIILCILLSQRKPCCYEYFTILFVLLFVTFVAVSRPCHFSEFYLNRASTLYGIALYYIRNYSPPPPPSSHLACIAGGILVPGVLSQRPRKAKRSEELQGKAHWLYTHSSCGSVAKTIQHPTLIPPATQATCSSHPSTLTPFVTTTLTHRSHLSPLTRMNFQPSPSWNNKLA